METKIKKEKKLNEPVRKWVLFPVSVAEFENEDGFKSYAITKAYKDKEDQWQNTTSFNASDLALIEKILRQI